MPVKVTAVFDEVEDHGRLMDDLTRMGAYDIDIEDVEPEPAPRTEPKRKKKPLSQHERDMIEYHGGNPDATYP